MPESLELSDPRGRPRSAATTNAVLRATLALLQQRPLREITIEMIAKAAGVGKATIYKWWPTKAFVALDAFGIEMRKGVVIPNTGSAEQDFIEQLQSVTHFYLSSTGRIFSQFLAECQSDQDFAVLFRQRFLKPRREAVEVIWQRGIDCGQIDPSINPDTVLDLVYGPLIFRLMAGHAPLDKEQASLIVAAAFRGVANKSET